METGETYKEILRGIERIRQEILTKLKQIANSAYTITLRQLAEEEGGGWLAEIPELPGCISDGETEKEALLNLMEAKEAYLECKGAGN